MGHGGRPPESERPASAKVTSLLPEDGREVPLTDLRRQAMTDLHMSPSTLTKTLRTMENSFLVARRVDTSGRRPLVYYSRTTPVEERKLLLPTKFDTWFDCSTSVIKFGLLSTFEEILKNPSLPLERVISDWRLAPFFDHLVLKWPWTILKDFQDATKRMDPKELVHLEKRVSELMGKSVNVETLAALNLRVVHQKSPK